MTFPLYSIMMRGRKPAGVKSDTLCLSLRFLSLCWLGGCPLEPQILILVLINDRNITLNLDKMRSTKLSIRVSALEQLKIVEDAHKSSMAVSSFARKKILGEPINQISIPEINLETYKAIVDLKKEINAVGRNLNQVAKFLQSRSAAPASLISSIDDAHEEIKRANQILGKIQIYSVGVGS